MAGGAPANSLSEANQVPVDRCGRWWWAANSKGEYDDEHRATQKADSEGRYRYETDFPARYPVRPLHLHVRVTASGHRPLVTQIYPKAGQASLTFDFVLVRE